MIGDYGGVYWGGRSLTSFDTARCLRRAWEASGRSRCRFVDALDEATAPVLDGAIDGAGRGLEKIAPAPLRSVCAGAGSVGPAPD